MTTSVLDGIRVLDLSWGIAGPITGMLLADHGADVIKVEPMGGDPFRGSPGYDCWLRGRRSIELDLRASDDHTTFLELVRSADVVLESFGPGVAAQLGVDAEQLRANHRRLIVATISAYGHHPEHRDRPGYDALVAARLGLLHEQRGHSGGPIGHLLGEGPYLPDLEIPEGMAPGAPRSGPIFTYTPWVSLGTAFLTTLAVSAALFARDRTGEGQHVETSMLQSALSMTASKWMRVERPDAPSFRTWIYDERAPKGFFRCSDGRWIQQWVPNPRFALSSADGDTLALRGVDRLTDDPDRISPDPENLVVLAYYHPLMVDAYARFPSADWVEVGARANVPLQTVRTPEEALNDEALIAEGAIADVPHPEYGTLRQAGILYTLGATPGRIQGPVPRVGEHSEGIRAEVGTLRPTPHGPGPEGPGACAEGPLTGITVLDLGFAVAGPFGTQLLAELGATVIKVNGRRDPWWHATHIAYGCNRGKRSIGIDLKHPEGRATLERLIRTADVFHSNMRRGALVRLGLDESAVRAANPEIVYCHTRGFDTGPRSERPGNDQTGCSLAGVTFEDGGGRDGGKPFWTLTSLGDTGNGFLSAIGVVQALMHRRRTGVSQSVGTSILNAAMLCASMTSLTPEGIALPRPKTDRMQLGFGAGYRLYPTTDEGWVCIALVCEAHWDSFATALGDPHLATARHTLGRAELETRIEPWFAARTAAAAWATLDAAGVPCEIASDRFAYGDAHSPGIHDDPEMARLGLVVTHTHPKVGTFEHFGRTLDFHGTPTRVTGPPPVCGAHTREILVDSGFTDSEISTLLDCGAVFEEFWVDTV